MMISLFRSLLGRKKEDPQSATPQKQSTLLRLQRTCARSAVEIELKRPEKRPGRDK